MQTTLIGTPDVAKLLGVKPVTVRAWRQRGTGPDYVMIADRAFYDRNQIIALAAARGNAA